MIRRLLFFRILFFAIAANAQQSVSISPIASFDFGSPLFINRAQGVLNPVSGSATGTSSSESYGVGVDATLPHMIGQIGLLGRIEGVLSTGRFDFNFPVYSVSGHDVKLLAEAGATWQAAPFTLRFGPWLSQAISTKVTEVDPSGNDITPSDAKSASTHFGLSAGVGWKIPNFPIRPEITTHLDLTELSQAGLNAWSAGLTIAYTFGSEQVQHPPLAEPVAPRPPPTLPLLLPRVKFLVNGTPSTGNPPLERVETSVKEYAMVDSANVPPRASQWVEDSYHLPHLTLSCHFDRNYAAYLMVLKDSLRLIEKNFPSASEAAPTEDTILRLEEDPAWRNVLVRLNTVERNQLVVELRSGNENLDVSRDTLILPAVDTSSGVPTTVKKQWRFVFSEDYSNVEGGAESLELLLDKLKAMLDSQHRITIREAVKPRNQQKYGRLQSELHRRLGATWLAAGHELDSDLSDAVIVVLEN